MTFLISSKSPPAENALPGPGDDNGVDVVVVVDVAPDVRELRVGLGIDGVVCLRPVEGDAHDPLRRIVDLQPGIGGVAVGHVTPLTRFSAAGLFTVSNEC